MSKIEKFEVEVTRKTIGDLFTTCMESGYSNWVSGAEIARGTSPEAHAAYEAGNAAIKAKDPKEPGMVWWGHGAVWEAPELTIELRYTREEDQEGSSRGKVHLTIGSFLAGFSAMSSSGEGGHSLGMILNDDMDGPSADVWLQHVVFGKAVYG